MKLKIRYYIIYSNVCDGISLNLKDFEQLIIAFWNNAEAYQPNI